MKLSPLDPNEFEDSIRFEDNIRVYFEYYFQLDEKSYGIIRILPNMKLSPLDPNEFEDSIVSRRGKYKIPIPLPIIYDYLL